MRLLSLAFAAASVVALAQTASAADLGVRGRAAPVVAAPVVAYAWTGCYVGANIGYGTAKSDWTITGTSLSTDGPNANGAVAGGQVGCDLQNGNFVFGVEGLFNWSGVSGSRDIGGSRLDTDGNWYATVTGRAGLAVDRTLFYVRGGAAFINNDFSFTVAGVEPSGDTTKTGWTLGAGAEWAFTPGWSARLEYNYMDFGSTSPTFCAEGVCGTGFDIDQKVHTFTVGLNYRFR